MQKEYQERVSTEFEKMGNYVDLDVEQLWNRFKETDINPTYRSLWNILEMQKKNMAVRRNTRLIKIKKRK